jgi:predicted phage terminase large subunit-like protein
MARHHALMDRKLVDVAKGRIKRLIIQMPPRHGKSELCAKYFTAWYRGMFPERKALITSATQPLAAKWSGEARDLLGQYGASSFGVTLRQDKAAASEWCLNEGGETRAAGVGGSIFGFGFHVGIIDDYFGTIEQALSETERNKVHQWFHGTMKNRQEDEGLSAIVIIATRYHKDDLVGRLLKEQAAGGEKWDVVRLPALAEENDPLGRQPGEALWPEKWSREYLEGERLSLARSGYPWMFEALYQQNPPDIIDSEWPSHYFDDGIWFDELPPMDRTACRVIAIDPSLGKSDTSDYSAIIEATRDHDGIYWIDADIRRRPATEIAVDAVAAHRRLKPDAIGCESVQFQELVGTLILHEAEKVSEEMNVCGIPADGEKKVRIRRLSPLLAGGKLKFRRNSPGTALLVEQIKGFPSHKYKDGPDALEMAVRLARHVLEGGLEA